MGKSFNAKAWIYESIKFLQNLRCYEDQKEYVKMLNYIIKKIMNEFGLPIIAEEVMSGDETINVYTTIIDDYDYYYICFRRSNDDRYELFINSDGKHAHTILHSNNKVTACSYKINCSISDRISSEKISAKPVSIDDSQVSLLSEIYDVLDIHGILYNSNKKPYVKGTNPPEYFFHDLKNRRKLEFKNEDGSIVMDIRFDAWQSVIELKICDGKATLKQTLKETTDINGNHYPIYKSKGEIPYEEKYLSEEVNDILGKLVKTLRKYDIDVSELPTELTDQTQYS